jgi:5-formyltetrahydrofolate cyclo-ligase
MGRAPLHTGIVTKTEARARIHRELRSLGAGEIAEMSERVAARLTRLQAWKEAGAVFTFLSIHEEVDTAPIIAAARAERKLVACPRIEGDELRFHLMDEADHPEPGAYGIREPAADAPRVDWDAAKAGSRILVITPGLGFDRRKHRLGRGKGFYDRFIREARERAPGRIAFIAVCFSLQLMDEVPHEPSDLPVDGIVTEDEIVF